LEHFAYTISDMQIFHQNLITQMEHTEFKVKQIIQIHHKKSLAGFLCKFDEFEKHCDVEVIRINDGDSFFESIDFLSR
jgi:hypothetical protein